MNMVFLRHGSTIVNVNNINSARYDENRKTLYITMSGSERKDGDLVFYQESAVDIWEFLKESSLNIKTSKDEQD